MLESYENILKGTWEWLSSKYEIDVNLFNKYLNTLVENQFIEKQQRLESEGKEFLEYEDL
mgnify:CR=1 FL=1